MIQQPKNPIAQKTSKTRVWNSKLVEEVRTKIVSGEPIVGGTPFHEGDIDYRAAEIIYEYSEEELREIAKCATDIVYFANKYCVSMTDEGIRKIKLRPYQEKALRTYQENRWVVFLASRQIGKTVMTGIFIAWYILFNIDKNVLILANKGATASEIMDKIKTVIKGLPFFLKPGITQNNVMTMRFDNGCRILAQSTTKSAAIGFTIHLAFMDEFAHIHQNFIEPFYRSVYPTLSSSQISRVIITSTANGMNKFWEIYANSMKAPGEEGKNEYTPLRVDWWEVPGRDEAWKKREIANLGSEELFNQEYGNQFLAADTLLLSADSLRYLKKLVTKYIWKEIISFEDQEINYKDLKWHPKFDIESIEEHDRFFISVDIADGIGRDYSVMNIFKIQEMSLASMRKLRKDRVEDERGFFRLMQVGLFRSNKIAVEDLARIAEILFYDFFKPEKLTIALEMNFKGDFFLEKLKKNENFFEEMFLHTKHNEKHHYSSLGVKLHKHNKMQFCRELRKLIMEKRVVLTEDVSYSEMSAFGINAKGSYSSQSGHDDVAMTTIYTSPFTGSDDFSFVVEEIVDQTSENFKKQMYNILEAEKNSESGNFSMLKEFM
jgi:hypothetical protein